MQHPTSPGIKVSKMKKTMKIIKNFVLTAVSLCGILGIVSCGGGKDDGTLYLYNWTYYTPDAVLEQFEKEFNCRVKVDSFDSNEVMYSKLKAGAKGYDIAFPSQDYTSIMIKQDMLLPVDKTKIPNLKYINPKCRDIMTFDPEMNYQVPYYMGMAGVAVNKQKVPEYDKSWNIFAREDLENHMSMMDDMREVIGDALCYLGYSVNDVNEAHLQYATDLINNQWKPNLVKFDAEGFGKSFASGDFWVCQGYAEVVYGEVPVEKQEEMLDFFIPKEGGPMYMDSMVILDGAKHYDRALEFINFIHRPEIYVQFLDEFRFPGYINPEADKLRTTKPMYKAEDMQRGELKLDIGENLEKFNDKWEIIRFTNN